MGSRRSFEILFVDPETGAVEYGISGVECVRFINPAAAVGEPGVIGYNVNGKLQRVEYPSTQKVEVQHEK